MLRIDAELSASATERSGTVAWFLTFTDRQLTRTIVYGLAVFVSFMELT
jgi:hypothetical protein